MDNQPTSPMEARLSSTWQWCLDWFRSAACCRGGLVDYDGSGPSASRTLEDALARHGRAGTSSIPIKARSFTGAAFTGVLAGQTKLRSAWTGKGAWRDNVFRPSAYGCSVKYEGGCI